jgi:hypothetical protein
MAVDGGESHLTEHDRSVYRLADYSRTINMTTNFRKPNDERS